MPAPGPMAKALYARYYARFGTWGQLELILQGDPIPKDLMENATRMRRAFLTEQERVEFAEKLRPGPKPKRVTFTNERGEEVTIDGFEYEGESL
jgi:hypothetical protein